jgi:hypothetical protein
LSKNIGQLYIVQLLKVLFRPLNIIRKEVLNEYIKTGAEKSCLEVLEMKIGHLIANVTNPTVFDTIN